MAGVFLASAAVQWNDPDPAYWIALYGVAAAVHAFIEWPLLLAVAMYLQQKVMPNARIWQLTYDARMNRMLSVQTSQPRSPLAYQPIHPAPFTAFAPGCPGPRCATPPPNSPPPTPLA